MEENKEAIEQNKEESIEKQSEEAEPAADIAVVDEDIQYTFVVPKGEVYREPETEKPTVETPPAGEESGSETDPDKTIVADHLRFTDEVNNALADAADADADDAFDSDDFFKTYKAADPTGSTVFMDPPVYDATGLPDDDITYTFVVPKGEIYKEPDPEEERAAKEAEKAKRAADHRNAEILSAETKVVERKGVGADDGDKTRYGLPANHPEMGELAHKQEERRLYKQRKKNLFRTRFYVMMTVLILAIGWLVLSNSGLFTIDAIVVQGNSHYTAEEIINMSHASPGRNIIYKANIKETKEFLENNPYIKHAEVRRRLPSTLVIKVTERQERLAFKYDDDYLVMDEDGILLKKTRNKPKTTIMQGVVVSKIKLGEKIGTENDRTLDRMLDLIKTMIKADLYFVKVDISKEKSVKAYIYDTLVVKTDYDTLITNMKNGRLHLVVENLFADGIERGTISFGEDGTASFMPIF
ncbi:MAG: FtsQ-type POTRA domain-containing protein [Mogibacterium sp.]|nr:FtsQ-type POTRA domain-containing protein [Mogibacterium sp.]